jgi:hypothetical protein
MRNANPDDFEAVPRPIVAVGNDYAPGIAREPHRHKRNQLLYGSTGLMIVGTEHGRWIVPPQRAVWIPAGIYHDVFAVGPVTTRSIFLERKASAKLPRQCQVLGITPLARALLLEAVDLPAKYDVNARAGLIMRLSHCQKCRAWPRAAANFSIGRRRTKASMPGAPRSP